ncbi:DNA repair endonuclease UVH1 [Glycine max]|nr:DNA repair endonuclease UVH1 [Glycine max]
MVQFHERIITELLEDTNGGLVVLSSGLSLSKLIPSLLILHFSSQGHAPSPLTVLHFPQIQNRLPPQNPKPPILPNSRRNHRRPPGAPPPRALHLRQSLLHHAADPNCRPPNQQVTYLQDRWHNHPQRTLALRDFHRSLHRSDFPVAQPRRVCPRVIRQAARDGVGIRKGEADDEVPARAEAVPVAAISGVRVAGAGEGPAGGGGYKGADEQTNKVDVEDSTVENGLFKSFDEIVRRQLDPIWHTLGKKTKQLVSDLKTLRKLLDYLVRYDAVTYLKYLDTLRVSESFRSVWLFAGASYQIFDYAKKRVFHLVKADGVKFNESSKSVKNKKRKTTGDDKDIEEGDRFFFLLSKKSASDIGDDVTPNSIISKLSLLALHFPRLRIIWSRSLHATAEIFASLKANQDEPDETKAIRVGVPSEEGIVENDVRAENYNTSAVEFLRRLPGVTDSNYRAIMDGLGVRAWQNLHFVL